MPPTHNPPILASTSRPLWGSGRLTSRPRRMASPFAQKPAVVNPVAPAGPFPPGCVGDGRPDGSRRRGVGRSPCRRCPRDRPPCGSTGTQFKPCQHDRSASSGVMAEPLAKFFVPRATLRTSSRPRFSEQRRQSPNDSQVATQTSAPTWREMALIPPRPLKRFGSWRRSPPGGRG